MFHNFPVLPRSETFVIAVDVDLTLVDTLSTWVEFLDRDFIVEGLPTPEWDHATDLVPFFENNGVKDPLEYWKKSDLYDRLKPNKTFVDFHFALVEAARAVTGKTVETICVSSCFPEHENSKKRFVRSVFGDSIPFISTSAKHLVDFDLIIDDSLGVAFNCLGAGKNVLHAPSPITRPSLGTTINQHFFMPAYDGEQWPYDWSGVNPTELIEDLLRISNK